MAGPLRVEELNLTIAEIFKGGQWNWERISYDLPREIKEQICAIPMQLWGEKEDTMMWKFTRDGEFSMALAYAQLRPEDTKNQTFEGHWIWKLDIWPKITSFLWLCFHDSVLVKQVIAKRGINCDPRCPLCRNRDESIAHMLKDCPFALNLWEQIGVPQPLTSSFHLDLLEWLKRNCLCSNQFHIKGIPWSFLFLFTVWELWKHRNGVVFDNKPLNFNLHHSCIRLATKYFFCVSK